MFTDALAVPSWVQKDLEFYSTLRTRAFSSQLDLDLFVNREARRRARRNKVDKPHHRGL